MKQLVAFIGVIGSGKDYQAELLNSNTPNSTRVGFSDGVREYAWKLLDWRPKNQKEYELFKLETISFDINGKEHFLTGRQFLQHVGTTMREFDNAFWAKYWYKQAPKLFKNFETVIISDCRYQEEVSIILKAASELNFEYKFILTNYKSEKYEINPHESESFSQKFINLPHLTDITEIVKQNSYEHLST